SHPYLGDRRHARRRVLTDRGRNSKREFPDALWTVSICRTTTAWPTSPPSRRRARSPTETIPNYLIGIGVIGLTVTCSVAGLVLVRRTVSLEVLQSNHEVASAKFQVMGTLYAVLIAFAVVIVWQQFQSAGATVAHEAAKITNLYR